jgi:hypothetical protein
MNFIIATLLLTFTDDQAFWIFESLISEYRLKGLFTESFPLLQLFMF